MIKTAYKKRDEERKFKRWIVYHQLEMSFDEFCQKLEPVRLKNDNETLKTVYGIIENVSKEVRNSGNI